MIQVAKALGAEVATTIRTPGKRGFVESLGADLVLDMNDKSLVQTTREWAGGQGADVVVDNLGGPNLADSVDAARPLGTVVLMGNVLGLESLVPVRSIFFPQKQIKGSLMGGIADLEWGLEQVKAAKIKPTLDRFFSLEEASEAHQYLADGKTVGNLSFKVA